MRQNKLTSLQVARAGPGRYGDGAGLSLIVSKAADGSLNRKWVFRFAWNGKPAECGLGGRGTSLSEARAKAEIARKHVRAGINPVEARRAAKKRVAVPSFGKCADALIASKRIEWRSEVHAAQWRATINDYCKPILGTPVDAIDKDAVLGILTPIWTRIPETAGRLRGRIESVLDFAKARGWRSGENPAAWRGNLAHILPKRTQLSRKHFAAMPYQDVPDFMTSMRQTGTIAAMALQFLILTASRAGEVLGARWGEFDIEAKVWAIPAGRMKSGIMHRVPLSERAVEIIERLAEIRTCDLVFPISRSSVSAIVPDGATTHGFRSSFRVWGAERNFPRELCEQSLAHTVGNSTELAYLRTDLLERRRALMESWAQYLEGTAADNVIHIRA